MTRSPAVVLVLALALGGCSSDPAAREPSRSLPPPSPSASGTGVAGDDAARFAVLGDWGAGTPAQRAVAQRMCRVRERRPFDVVVTTGDNFYERGTARPETYAVPMRCLLAYPGHRWRAAWGNHDIRGTVQSTRTILDAPHFYTFTIGDAQVVVLDSNAFGNAEQRRWLEETLRASSAPVRIAVFHHPPYAAALHEPSLGVRRAWGPLFRRYGVDLVLNGHDHAYEHHVAEGIHYVVTGGGGAYLHRCLRRPPELVTCRSEHHFLLVEVLGRRVDVHAIAADGSTLDRVRFTAAAP